MANGLRKYVDGIAGDDGNSGELGSPYKTLNATIIAAQAAGNDNWIYFQNITHTTALTIGGTGTSSALRNKLIQQDTGSVVTVPAGTGITISAVVYYDIVDVRSNGNGINGIYANSQNWDCVRIINTVTSNNVGSGTARAGNSCLNPTNCIANNNGSYGFGLYSGSVPDVVGNTAIENAVDGFQGDDGQTARSPTWSNNVARRNRSAGFNIGRPIPSGQIFTFSGNISIGNYTDQVFFSASSTYTLNATAGIYIGGTYGFRTWNNNTVAYSPIWNISTSVMAFASHGVYMHCGENDTQEFSHNTIYGCSAGYSLSGSVAGQVHNIRDCIIAYCGRAVNMSTFNAGTVNAYNTLFDSYGVIKFGTGTAVWNQDASCVTSGASAIAHPAIEDYDWMIKTASAARGIGATSDDAGAYQYIQVAAPVISSPGSITVYTTTVLITGTASVGEQVEVTVGGVVYAAPVTAGAWSITVPLSVGANVISAVARDYDRGTGASASITVTLAVPTAPVITTAPATIYTDTATVAGTITAAEQTSRVDLYIGAAVVGSAVPSGTAWSVEIPVGAGANVITAKAVNATGSSAASTGVTLTVSAPTAPVITTAGSTIYTNTQALIGTLTGSQNTYRIDIYNNGSFVESAVPSGTNWSATIPVAFGANVITAKSVNSPGESSASVSKTFTVGVPSAPVITTSSGSIYTDTVTVSGTYTGGQGAYSVDVYDAGVWAAEAETTGLNWTAFIATAIGAHTLTAKATNVIGISTPSNSIVITASVPAAPVITNVGGSLTVPHVLLQGTSANSEYVTVRKNGSEIGAAGVTAGAWSIDAPLSVGANAFTAYAVNDLGISIVSNSVSYTYTVETFSHPATLVLHYDAVNNIVEVEWTVVAGASAYKIRRYSNVLEEPDYEYTALTNSFDDTEVVRGKTYSYTVASIGDSGVSEYYDPPETIACNSVEWPVGDSANTIVVRFG